MMAITAIAATAGTVIAASQFRSSTATPRAAPAAINAISQTGQGIREAKTILPCCDMRSGICPVASLL